MKKLDWITFEWLLYVLKCILGLVICYFFYWLFPQYRFHWSIVSVLLVLSPDDLDSKKLPVSRIKANIIGSMVGLLIFLIHPPNLLMMCIGTVLTIIICSIIKLGAATRPALAALIIVLVQEGSQGSWINAFERMISVILGCLVALAITFLMQYIVNHIKKS